MNGVKFPAVMGGWEEGVAGSESILALESAREDDVSLEAH